MCQKDLKHGNWKSWPFWFICTSVRSLLIWIPWPSYNRGWRGGCGMLWRIQWPENLHCLLLLTTRTWCVYRAACIFQRWRGRYRQVVPVIQNDKGWAASLPRIFPLDDLPVEFGLGANHTWSHGHVTCSGDCIIARHHCVIVALAKLWQWDNKFG